MLKGTCRIRLALARTPYRNTPKEYAEYIANGRMEIISLSDTPRQTRESAYQRNLQIAKEADEVVFASLSDSSSLRKIHTLYKDKSTTL